MATPKPLSTPAKLKLLASGATVARTAARHATDPEWEVRVRAFEVLAKHGNAKQIGLAVAALDDPEATVVVSALECLVEWNARRFSTRIAALLDSRDELTRSYAAWALGRLGTVRFAPLLRRRLRVLDDTAERSGVLKALVTLTKQPRYLVELLRQLHSRDPFARAFTTNSLIGVASKKSCATLISALAHALVTEKSEYVAFAIRRDLTELVALAVEWHSPPARKAPPRRRRLTPVARAGVARRSNPP